MILNELFKPKKTITLFEGGNLELPNPNDPTAPYQADEIDLKVHNRSFMVGLLDKLLNDINGAFYSKYKKPLWNPNLLQSKQFLGGSSLHFFNTDGISDKEFAKHKPKVGDIDTQCNKELEPEIRDFLTAYDHKQIGDTTLLGFSQGSEQLNALFQFQDPPIKIQIDFEFGRYNPETDMPDEWYRFSHSSEWNDIQEGIKGVFHKYIYRALTSAHSSIKHQVDVKKTKTNIKPNVRDNDLSFAVASGQGGGLSQKYEPYIHTDPETGEKQTHKDKVPYKRLIPSAQRTYIQDLDKQFYYFFGTNPEDNDKELQKSFLGTLELINKYIPDPASKQSVFTAFLELCFEPGNAQMITKNDPERDQEIKFAAIDNFVKVCKLGKLRNTAVEMGKAYIDEFKEVQAYKQEHPEEKQPRAALKRAKAANQPVEENFADGKNPGRKEIDPDVYEDLDNSIIARIARQIVPTIRAKSTPEGYVYLSTQDGLSLVIGCNIAGGSIGINLGSQPMEDASSGPHKGAVTKIISAVYAAAVKHYGVPTEQGTLSIDHDAGHGVWQHIAQKLGLQYDAHMVKENFADGRHPEDKGDSKRHGIPKHASLSQLDKMTHAGGRKGQLAHWQANMRRGRAKHHESLSEAEVKAQLRKGMPHLKDLKAADFLDLLDEIHDGNGNFKLENMPLNVKVDGFGGRFGKNADGKPFMGTSRTEPRYAPGFLKYHQEKGTQDPEILGRAKLFDDLFVEMMNAVKLVDSKLGPDFLMDKQVSCEVLFLPFATETEEGKLKFVGIHYDKLPQGVQLALVPFHVVTASTGEPVENSQEIVKELTGLGQQSSVMFIDNSLTQNEALDVTAIIPPLENIEELKSIVSDTMGKRDRASLELKKNVEAQLQPVKLALEKAIAEDPNIIGKDMLGKDYEGIVLNTRLGPVKITSAEQRAVIAGKQAAKTSARTERPRGESKTAVVAIGSFIGHKGHEELFNYTINKAKELGGDPYLFIGNAEGKDDPIPPAVKVQTWHKLYPEYANNISTVQQGGQLIQKIKHELINPLPGKPPRYDNIVIMVGEDRKDLNMPQALMKAVNKFQGYEHVKVSLGVTPRGTGISGTMLRNSLKNDPPEKALAIWSNAFDVKKLGKDWIEHLMDITRKGMGIQQQTQQQPAPVAERLFNALMAPKVNESTSLESTIKNIVTNGEPIAQLYEKLKAMAKRWVDNNGSLKGYHRNAAGQSAQWFNNFYWNKMQGDLYDLTKQASKYAPPLIAFLKDASEDRERSINFREISASLPSILQQIGTRMGNKELASFGANWNKRQQDYENYLARIEAEVDTDDDDGYEEPKAPKDNTFGKQNVQADQIVNDILKNLPSKVAGDIRNAIARSPNKLQALQAELQKRGVKAPMAESLIESARMSAAVKLHRAWEREQAKSTASRKRGEEYMNQIKQDVANKNQRPPTPKEVEDESIMGFLATPKPVAKKSTTSSADMRKYFEKDKPAKPEKTERGDGGEKIQRVYTRSDESVLNELDMFAPRTVYFKMGDGNYIKADYRGSETMFGGGHKENDQVNFTSMSWVSPNTARSLGLDKTLAKGSDPNDTRSQNAHSIVSPQYVGQAGPWGQRSLDVVDFINSKEDTVPSELKTQVAQWVEKNRPKAQPPKQGVAEGSEEKHDFIPVKLLKRNVPYWLTYDFYGHGGKLVKLSGPHPTNNNFIVVKDQDGNKYSVSKKAVLFASDPNQNKGREQGVAEDDTHQIKGNELIEYLMKRFEMTREQAIELLKKKGLAEGGAKYKVRSIGQDKKGEYYISPSTGEKVYKKAKVGDHEVPGSKEIKPKVEAMMPASNFAGSKKNKLGTAGQLKATAKHAKQGDLVGGAAESVHSPAQRAAIAIAKQKEVDEDQRLDPHCWKGYRKQGTKMKGGTRVNNCVKVSEDVENKMSDLIRLLENK